MGWQAHVPTGPGCGGDFLSPFCSDSVQNYSAVAPDKMRDNSNDSSSLFGGYQYGTGYKIPKSDGTNEQCRGWRCSGETPGWVSGPRTSVPSPLALPVGDRRDVFEPPRAQRVLGRAPGWLCPARFLTASRFYIAFPFVPRQPGGSFSPFPRGEADSERGRFD